MEKSKKPTEFDIRSRERLNYIIAKYCNGSQQELSKRTGVGKASISQYVNGKNTPSNLTALALCTPFKINPAWLQGFDVPMMREDTASGVSLSNLSKDEKLLIDRYRAMNQEGRDKLTEYAEDLTMSGRYIKTDPDKVVDEEA